MKYLILAGPSAAPVIGRAANEESSSAASFFAETLEGVVGMFRRSIPPQRKAPTGSEVADARFRRFARDLEAYERKLAAERTLDSLLDLYGQWRKTRDPSLKMRLVMLAFELHDLDHEFRCELSFADR